MMDMKIERNRLQTFKNGWPKYYVNPSALAAVGFFYLGQGDRVQCAFCHGIILDWLRDDDPLIEHVNHFPLCPFLLNRYVGNTMISGGESPFTDHFNYSYLENSEYFRRRKTVKYPKFSGMQIEERRRRTFQNWNYPVEIDDLVHAGFFYSGEADMVICFHCGGQLNRWNAHEIPLNEHKKHFPQCTYANYQDIMHGPVEVSLQINPLHVPSSIPLPDPVSPDHMEISPPINGLCAPSSDPVLPDPAKSTVTSLSCKICWNKEMEIVFLPCGHMIACLECAQCVTMCPICRKTIDGKIKVFMG